MNTRITKGYTYIHTSDKTRNSRIDYIFVPNTYAQTIQCCSVISCPAPDHKALSVTLCLSTNKRGNGFWKLNNSLLHDEEYKAIIRSEITHVTDTYGLIITKQELVDLIKVIVKESSIKYSTCKKARKLCKISQIENELDLLDRTISNSSDPTLPIKRESLKNELNNLYQENSTAAYIRSRAKWLEEGEKSTPYFLNLEKQHQSINCIHRLRGNDGNKVTTDSEILEEARKFYTKLYSTVKHDPEKIENYLDEIKTLKKLSEIDSQSLEGEITKSECEKALLKMKGNKSPGLDGLSIEFYKTFWPELGDLIVESFNEAFQDQLLVNSRNVSILSLIFKKGDPSDIKNYRPISLTNTDYKLLAHVLANRLHTILHKIISTDQTGYIRKRYIGTNIRKILDTVEYLDKTKQSGILLMLDFEKAFDTVEWPFLFKALERFNFGPQFVSWVKLLYRNPSALIKNNGWFSNKITMTRGIRQGCPVSALLFIIIAEVLATVLKESSYEGITVKLNNKTKEMKVSQYADDTCLLIKDEAQIETVLKIIDNFGIFAGPKLNIKKTEGIHLGNKQNQKINCPHRSIKWSTDPIRCLGVYVGTNCKKCDNLNWWSKLPKIQSQLTLWKMRNLTIIGKITLIKHLIIPKLLFSCQFFETPNGFIKKLECMLFEFIWNSKDRIKRNTLKSDVQNGGLGMIDFESKVKAMKASWMPKIINGDSDWSFFGNEYFNSIGVNQLFLHYNFTDAEHFPPIKNIPSFYQSVILAYNDIKTVTIPDNRKKLLEETLWGNMLFTQHSKHGKTLFYKNWVLSGVITLNSLRFIDGSIDETFIYNKICDKRNIYCEILSLRKALVPYKDMLAGYSNTPQENYRDPCIDRNLELQKFTSKLAYNILVTKKYESPFQEKVWHKVLKIEKIDFTNVYPKKIKMADKKLAEFNYKVLLLILPCGLNLNRWGIRDNNKCNICNVTHDIPHLLFYCTKADAVWKTVSRICGIDISLKYIILSNDLESNLFMLIIIVAFSIYKEWLLYGQKVNWQTNDIVLHVKLDLSVRIKIYENVHSMSSIVAFLKGVYEKFCLLK